ncbi:hypothetical protein ACI78T_15690 [Blastococcus sp. SYSU D00922]
MDLPPLPTPRSERELAPSPVRRKVRETAGRRPAPDWRWVLVGLGALLLAVNTVAFYPGFMSTDSVQQLTQALDTTRLNDWHPPVMTALWWLLLKVSFQTVGSMLLVQLAVLWSSLTALALYVHGVTGRRGLSLLPLVLGLLPYVANISAVIWKDDHLAFALLGAVVLLLFVRRGVRRRSLRWAAVAGALALLAYAGAVRYNALPAIIPILFLITWPSAGTRRRKRVLLAGVAVLAAVVVTPLIDVIRPVEATHPAASIMLDDVMHVYTVDELRSADVRPELKRYLLSLADLCPPDQLAVNYTWRCANPTLEIPPFFRSDYDDLRGLYLRGIAEHPLRYAEFRLSVFADFLDTPPAESFVYWHGIDANPQGLAFERNLASDAVETYVAFSASSFGFLFKPWFWLLSGLAVTGVAWRRRASSEHARVVVALGVSAVIYIATYLPTVIGFDYRYVYWSAIAVSVAGLLLLADRVRTRPVTPEASAEGETSDVPRPRTPSAPDVVRGSVTARDAVGRTH